MNKICFKKVNSGDFAKILLLKVRKLDVSYFVSATRDLTPNFIKLKNCIQKVYDSPSILNNCMIMCGKLISYEYKARTWIQQLIYVDSININRFQRHKCPKSII